jgi:transposase
MTKAYSNDLRERVVAAVEACESCRSVATRFGVSVSSVVKWAQRWRATGSVRPDRTGGYRPVVLEPHRDFIIEQMRRCSHVTTHGLQRMLAARGVKVSHDSVWRFLRREGLSLKKSLFATEQARAGIASKRRRWKRFMTDLDPSRLVFVDVEAGESNRSGGSIAPPRVDQRPIWRRCAAGAREASGSRATHRMATDAL